MKRGAVRVISMCPGAYQDSDFMSSYPTEWMDNYSHTDSRIEKSKCFTVNIAEDFRDGNQHLLHIALVFMSGHWFMSGTLE